MLVTVRLLYAERFRKVSPPWRSSLASIDGRSSQQTSRGRSKIFFGGYGTSQRIQGCVVICSWGKPFLTPELQVDEELGRQMAQMKLIVQGTPGSSATYKRIKLSNNAMNRG